MTHALLRGGRRRRGWASAMIVIILLICASIAAAAVFQNVGARQEAEAVLARERAFQAAEAGCDWGLMRMRVNRGEMPAVVKEDLPLDATASCTIRFSSGRTDGVDDDGDGTVDESDEGDYTVLLSTGTAGGVRRTLHLLLKKVIQVPTFPAATHIADPTPILDVNGGAFRVSGEDHAIDGTIDAALPAKYGVSSPADPSVMEGQIPAARVDQITGLGGTPSVGQSAAIDLDSLIDLAASAATIEVTDGNVTDAAWGVPTKAGVEVVHVADNMHVSGTLTGAGVLVVDGDLVVTGGVTWVGIILVRGGVRFSGGGGTRLLIGAMACSQGVSNEVLSLAGTVDLLYSSAGVMLAQQALATPVPVSWRETGSPAP
jgi:hypothetical protein